jgi:hypothetical protein
MINLIATLTLPFLMATAPSQATPSTPVDSSTLTLVVVQNDRSVSVTVYAQNDFGEYKLGVVEPYESATLSLADYMLAEGDVQFFVHPVGQLDESTEPLELHRGERIGLVIPPRK